MASSDSEEDTSRFREAIDTSFFTNNMFDGSVQENKNVIKKSNRLISDDRQFRDISVSSNMQKIVGEKLSNIIKSKIEFVDIVDHPIEQQNTEFESHIKLFSDSTNVITDDYPTYTDYPRVKVEIKKRKCFDDIAFNKKDAILAASVSSDFILDKNNTKHWKSRRKTKVYEYVKCKKTKKLDLVNKTCE